jgi:hypothetical protein
MKRIYFGVAYEKDSNPDVIVDFITGQSVPNIGAEVNRQQMERYLIETKGYRHVKM